MRLRHIDYATQAICEHIIAQFGKGRLVRETDGHLILKGGTPADCSEAQEYVSLFMHEAVLSFAE
jgi:hypothetical protein